MKDMKDWDSNQYLKFEKERTRPTVDLISRIDISPESILDIGCGPGNSTYQLYKYFPDSDILGIDNSDDMLAKAKNTYENIKFEKMQVPTDLDRLGKFDLIFSNACLHWIPNHKQLLGTLMNKINDGGMIAVQVPFIQNAMFYKMLDKFISAGKWRKLKDICIFHSPMPNDIYDILSGYSKKITMWETTYYHVLSSHDAVIRWYGGSGLRPYLAKLDTSEKDEFLHDLSEMIKKEFPIQSDNSVILKMPRVFYTAIK